MDIRFALPYAPRTAAVIGRLEGWREGLREAGMELDGGRGDQAPDLAVAPRRLAKAAIATAADMVVIESRAGGRSLRSAAFAVQRLLPLPGPEAPAILIPLDHAAAARYAIRTWTVPTRRWKAARNRILELLLSRGSFPPGRPVFHVGTRSPGPPFMVEAARRELKLPSPAGWFLTLGEGDALTRGVFHLLPPGADEPEWVLKFARVLDYRAPFDRDQRGLELVREAGGAVARHAPRMLGRLSVQGLAASAETAAAGQRLTAFLQAPGGQDEKQRAVEEVAEWLVESGRATARASARLEPEINRLAVDVVPQWRRLGAERGLVSGLEAVPAVLEHRDLGTWNLIRSARGFVAVDWESSQRDGFPLWDLLYFLTDALAHIDGASPHHARHGHASRLYRGALGSSALLFRWVRAMVEALGIPRGAVGRLATLCWLHHGLSHVGREAVASRLAPGAASASLPLEGMARQWLTDPALGPGWTRWEGA